ncbi:hypothetical protein Peur_014792 [Populus x canadensis]
MVFKPEALIWKSMAADSTERTTIERTDDVPDDEHDSKNETRPVKKTCKDHAEEVTQGFKILKVQIINEAENKVLKENLAEGQSFCKKYNHFEKGKLDTNPIIVALPSSNLSPIQTEPVTTPPLTQAHDTALVSQITNPNKQTTSSTLN